MNSYKRWTVMLLSLMLVALAAVMFANYLIDPYNVFKAPTFKRLNVNKVESKEYLMKARDIVRLRPEVIFLGSSRTSFGLDPQYYATLTGETAYNAGLSAATIDIDLDYLKYALMNNPNLKKVILGLDFASFNRSVTSEDVLKQERVRSKWYTADDLLNNLLTMQTTKMSIKLFLDNFLEEEKYTNDLFSDDGRQNEEAVLPERIEMLQNGRNIYYKHLSTYMGAKGYYQNFELSEERLNTLKELVNLCKERQIELHVYINPAHAIQWEGIELTGNWETFENWKRELLSITPVWDFSGFNSISTSAPDNFKDFIDQSHYRKHIGNLVLNVLLNHDREKVPDDFGTLLMETTIDEHLSELRTSKIKWENANPLIIQTMLELYPIK